MILLDVNVLVYAHREDAERHAEYRSWLESTLDGIEGCAISELVLSGCLRILTHPKVFNPPTPLPKAMAYVGKLWYSHEGEFHRGAGCYCWDFWAVPVEDVANSMALLRRQA